MKIVFKYIPGRLKHFLLLIHMIILMPAPQGYADDLTIFDPYEVKAALLIKFTDFVKWPPDSFFEDPDTFVLGILGYDVFEGIFDSYNAKKIGNKNFVVKKFCNVDEIRQVQVLFISRSEKYHLPEILEFLKDRNILTVGDTKGFAEKGVLVNFIEKKGNIGFEINIDAKNRTNLNISSHLLRLAEIVKDKKKHKGKSHENN